MTEMRPRWRLARPGCLRCSGPSPRGAPAATAGIASVLAAGASHRGRPGEGAGAAAPLGAAPRRAAPAVAGTRLGESPLQHPRLRQNTRGNLRRIRIPQSTKQGTRCADAPVAELLWTVRTSRARLPSSLVPPLVLPRLRRVHRDTPHRGRSAHLHAAGTGRVAAGRGGHQGRARAVSPKLASDGRLACRHWRCRSSSARAARRL